MHPLHLLGAARDHRQLAVKTFKIELTHHTVMGLFHQEHARARFELLLDQLEFALGEAKPRGVIGEVGVRIGEEHLGGRLLHQGSADGLSSTSLGL